MKQLVTAKTKRMKGLNRRTKKTGPFSMMRYENRKTFPFIEDFMQNSIEAYDKREDNSDKNWPCSDNKVLNELAEKLTEYLRELPVLGFNSGKYDLNAVKEFFLPTSLRLNQSSSL